MSKKNKNKRKQTQNAESGAEPQPRWSVTPSTAALLSCTTVIAVLCYRSLSDTSVAQADETHSASPAVTVRPNLADLPTPRVRLDRIEEGVDLKRSTKPTATKRKSTVLPRAASGEVEYFIDRDVKTPTEVHLLSTFPQLAKAKTRSHRVIELRLNKLVGTPPIHRHEQAITVTMRQDVSKEILLESTQFFFLADELQATSVDGRALTADELLDAVTDERVVVLTHTPNELPDTYATALDALAIVIQVPLVPNVPVSKKAFGVDKTRAAGLDLRPFVNPAPAIDTFPQLCTATTKAYGIVEVSGCRLRYASPKSRADKALSINTPLGAKEVALAEQRHRYLATELKAYYRDGRALTRDKLLWELQDSAPVLVTIAPRRPPAEYLAVLSEAAIVLELPHEPVVRLDPRVALPAPRHALPPSGLPDTLSFK